jgi:hypothetical protein
MVDRIKSNKVEYQEVLVDDIPRLFGFEWTYDNESGNPSISRKVLAAFKKLHGGSLEWDRHERYWSVV